jgi:hypothetical protein
VRRTKFKLLVTLLTLVVTACRDGGWTCRGHRLSSSRSQHAAPIGLIAEVAGLATTNPSWNPRRLTALQRWVTEWCATTERGAIVEGRPIPQYGDRSP